MKRMEDGPYYFANNQYVKAGTCFRKIGGFSDDTDRLKLSIVGYIDFITNNGGVKSADGWSLASCLSYVASGDWYICEDLQLIKNVITDVSIKPDLDKYVHLPKDPNGTIDSGPNVYVKTDHEILPIGKVISDEKLKLLKSIIDPKIFQKEYECTFSANLNKDQFPKATYVQGIIPGSVKIDIKNPGSIITQDVPHIHDKYKKYAKFPITLTGTINTGTKQMTNVVYTDNRRTKSGAIVNLLRGYGWRVISRNNYRHITSIIHEGSINGCPVTGRCIVTGKTEVQKLIKSLKETTIF